MREQIERKHRRREEDPPADAPAAQAETSALKHDLDDILEEIVKAYVQKGGE